MAKKNTLTFSINSRGYIYATFYAKDGRVNTSIGKQVTKEAWASKSFDKGTKRTMDRLSYVIDGYATDKDSLILPTSKAEVQALIDFELGRKGKEKTDTVINSISLYRDLVKSGKIDNGGKPYSKATGRHLDAIIGILEDNPVLGSMPLSRFCMEHFTLLKQVMLKDRVKDGDLKRGYTQNTMCVYAVTFVKFFKRTRKLKWHDNAWYFDEETTISKEDIDTHVYLTEAEIQALSGLSLSPRLAKIRDLFVFGCYIGLRHTDLSRLRHATLKDNILHVLAKKGGKTVHIPLNTIARDIWARFGGVVPVRDNDKFNTDIRTICKQAGFNELCLYVRTEGGVKVEKHLPKWRMIGTHSMRRSFATNAYVAGVPPVAIMKITGHRTESSFIRYIRISNEENATEMLKHAFFR